MTDILTEKGNGDGKTFAIINGCRYDVPGYVQADLNKLDIGTEVGFNETNNIITKIWKKRAKPAVVPAPYPNQKNEKLIVYQHNFGIVADSYFSCFPLDDEPNFDTVMKAIYEKTREISDQMMQDCGAV